MKIVELKENKPLEIIEVSNHIYFKGFPNPNNGKLEGEPKVYEDKKIKMKVFTDGQIVKEDNQTSKSINEYYVGKSKYAYDVDTLTTKDIYFKDYSFIITYLLVNKPMQVGNIRGWFDVIEDVVVYVKDIKDKTAIKKAKNAICDIERKNRSVDFSNLFTFLLSQRNNNGRYESEKVLDNVYVLRMK